MLDPSLRQSLRCPATRLPLRETSDGFVSEDGSHRYPVVDGRPVLIAEERSIFRHADYAPASPRPASAIARLRRLRSRLPRDSANVGGRAFVERFAECVDETVAERGHARVLIIGTGEGGESMSVLYGRPGVEITETDVFLGDRVQLVCDAHDLPFADGTFDGIVCQAVLEHVVDPPRVVSEIHRVLAEGGFVYSEVPFMQQVHEGAFDFTRFTMQGHRRLFRWFDEVAAGPVCGPGMALAWSLRYYLMTLAGGRRWLAALLATGIRLLTFPLPRLDALLLHLPGAADAASATGFLGRRRDRPVDDLAIVRAYRGLAPTPQRW